MKNIASRTLAEFIMLSKDGEWGKDEPFDDSVQMRVVHGTDFDSVRSGDWSRVPTRYVSRKHAELKALTDGDLLIETAGGSPGRPTGRTIFLRRGSISGQNMPVTCASFARFVRLDPTLVEPEFVFWWLQHQYTTGQLLAFHTQHTGVARFQWTTCSRSIVVPQVERPIQRKIAAILSAYDDLIENNNRRIKLLEEVVQRIYREWFIDFRYPRHEEAQLVNSKLGLIPEGWSVAPLPGIATVKYGKNLPSSALDGSGGYLVYGAAKVIGRHSSKNISRRTIIMGCRGSCGAVTITAPEAFVTNNSFTLDTTDETQYYLFLLLQQRGVEEFITGSAQPQITLSNIAQLHIVCPARPVLEHFHSLVAPAFELRYSLEARLDNLCAIRDLLLPRLVSGEIDVLNLNMAIPELAA